MLFSYLFIFDMCVYRPNLVCVYRPNLVYSYSIENNFVHKSIVQEKQKNERVYYRKNKRTETPVLPNNQKVFYKAKAI